MKKNSYSLLLKLKRQRKILREQAETDKPAREIEGVEISADYGESWKLHVLCTDCTKEIEPSLQRHRLGARNVTGKGCVSKTPLSGVSITTLFETPF